MSKGRVVATLLCGMAVALGVYFLAAELGAGRHVAGAVGGGLGAFFTSLSMRRWPR